MHATIKLISLFAIVFQRERASLQTKGANSLNKKTETTQVTNIWLQQKGRQQFYPASSIDSLQFLILWTLCGKRFISPLDR